MSQTVTVPCPVYCLAWSPNGKLVAFGGSSQKIYVHHKELGKLIKSPAVKQLSGHLHNIISLKFFPDNAILVSASWDGKYSLIQEQNLSKNNHTRNCLNRLFLCRFYSRHQF